jgi:hypothetical protein
VERSSYLVTICSPGSCVAVGEVDEIAALSDLSPDDKMLARHGGILDSDTDATEAGLWQTQTFATLAVSRDANMMHEFR